MCRLRLALFIQHVEGHPQGFAVLPGQSLRQHRRAGRPLACAAAISLVLVGTAAALFSFSAGQLRERYGQHFASCLHSVYRALRAQPVTIHTCLLQAEPAEGVVIRIQGRDS